MQCGLFIMGTRTGSYHDILEQVQYAEQLGFHSVALPERHFSHGDLLCPSPLIVAGAIATSTSRIRIATAARILALDHPLHIAEDAATVDVLSKGRLDFGVARASLDEEAHLAFGPGAGGSRERFEEALEVIVRAWTENSFSHYGTHYQIPDVSLAPKPLQRHPPIYVVAVSRQTLKFAARKGYSAFVGAILSIQELEAVANCYLDELHQHVPIQGKPGLSVNRFIYVSETDNKARREIEGPFMEFMLARAPDLKAALLRHYGGIGPLDFDRLANDCCVFGSPETVTQRLTELQARVGAHSLLCSLNYVTLDHDRCIQSMELFAREVMPSLNGRSMEPTPQNKPTVHVPYG